MEVAFGPTLLTVRWDDPPGLLQVPPDRVTHSRVERSTGELVLTLEVRLGATDGPDWSHVVLVLPFPGTAEERLARLRHALRHGPEPLPPYEETPAVRSVPTPPPAPPPAPTPPPTPAQAPALLAEPHAEASSRHRPPVPEPSPVPESPPAEPPQATEPVRVDGPQDAPPPPVPAAAAGPRVLWIEPCPPADASGDGQWLRFGPPTETRRLLRPEEGAAP